MWLFNVVEDYEVCLLLVDEEKGCNCGLFCWWFELSGYIYIGGIFNYGGDYLIFFICDKLIFGIILWLEELYWLVKWYFIKFNDVINKVKKL